MIKAVIDTNIFISSFFGGNPRRIIESWKRGEITLCLSRAILEEYVKVLRRMKLGEEEVEALLAFFSRRHHLIFCTKTPALRIVEKDPDDDKFIECAAALKADFIVTGDKALRSVGEYRRIRIVTPKEFLEAARK